MQHDKTWLWRSVKDVYDTPSDDIDVQAVVIDRCKAYHEHMESKKAEADSALLASLPEFECVNCNYTYKGAMMCKCHLRITAEMRDAILAKELTQ